MSETETKLPKALQLAKTLDWGTPDCLAREAASELRRLYTEARDLKLANDALKKAMEETASELLQLHAEAHKLKLANDVLKESVDNLEFEKRDLVENCSIIPNDQ